LAQFVQQLRAIEQSRLLEAFDRIQARAFSLATSRETRQALDVRQEPAELRDRYGDPPAPVRQLLHYAALRLQAVQAGVTAIDTRAAGVTVRVAVPDTEFDVAVMVVVPVPTLVARPELLAVLLTVPTDAADEVQ